MHWNTEEKKYVFFYLILNKYLRFFIHLCFSPTMAYISKWVLNCIFIWGLLYASLAVKWNYSSGIKYSYIHFEAFTKSGMGKFGI